MKDGPSSRREDVIVYFRRVELRYLRLVPEAARSGPIHDKEYSLQPGLFRIGRWQPGRRISEIFRVIIGKWEILH